MKKILLASTILAGTASFAAADSANFTFSGEAYMGMAFSMNVNEPALTDYDRDGVLGEADVDFFTPEVKAEFTAGMMTTTDMGLEAGASVTVEGGNITVESDHTEGAFATASTGGNSVADASVYVSGDWGKLEAVYDADGTDDGLFDEPDVTFTYSYSFGDFGVEAYYTWAGDLNFDGFVGRSDGDIGVEGTYSFGDYSVFAAFDWDASDGVDGDYEITVGGEASMSGFSLGAEASYENVTGDWTWKANASYTTGAYTIGAFVEDDDTLNDLDFGINGSYSLGGGVSVDAAYIMDSDTDRSLAKLGVSMAF